MALVAVTAGAAAITGWALSDAPRGVLRSLVIFGLTGAGLTAVVLAVLVYLGMGQKRG